MNLLLTQTLLPTFWSFAQDQLKSLIKPNLLELILQWNLWVADNYEF